MKKLIRTQELKGGLTVEFYDNSNRYFGDYHRICIETRSRLPLAAELFAASPDPEVECERVRALIGEEIVFERTLEKMGVAGVDLETVKEDLIESFISSSFRYMEKPGYLSGLIKRELTRRKKPVRSFALSRRS